MKTSYFLPHAGSNGLDRLISSLRSHYSSPINVTSTNSNNNRINPNHTDLSGIAIENRLAALNEDLFNFVRSLSANKKNVDSLLKSINRSFDYSSDIVRVSIGVSDKQINNSKNIAEKVSKNHVVYIASEKEVVFSSVTFLDNNNLRTQIIDNNQSLYLDIIYENDPSGGWTLNMPSPLNSITVQSEVPFDAISGITAVMWLSLQMINSRKLSLKNDRINKGESLHEVRYRCFQHDYLCTFSFGESTIITLDGRLYLWFPCGGEVEINVLDCCQQHDIDLWCSETRYPDAWLADAKVIACVVGKVLSKITAYNFICDIINVAFFLSYYSDLVSLFFVGSLASPALYSGNVLGLNGRNRNTCLCGGREPVALCTDECRDICKERGLPVDCVPCQWRCEYRNGIPLNNGHPRFIPRW